MTDVVSVQVVFVSSNDDLHQVRAKDSQFLSSPGKFRNLLTGRKEEIPILHE